MSDSELTFAQPVSFFDPIQYQAEQIRQLLIRVHQLENTTVHKRKVRILQQQLIKQEQRINLGQPHQLELRIDELTNKLNVLLQTMLTMNSTMEKMFQIIVRLCKTSS
jgi:hypothetical protein